MAFQILLVLLLMAVLAPQNLQKYIPDIDGLITFTRGYRNWVGGSPAVLWTLRAEFWFYVLFPLVLCAAGKARVAGCIVGGIAIAWLSKVLIGHNHEGWLNQFGIFAKPLAKTEPFVFTMIYLDQLMYGAACAVLIERKSEALRYFQSRVFLWAPLLAVCLLATIPFRAYDRVWYLQTSAAALLTAILILHHAQRPTRHDFEPIATLGRISFSIYLLHIVVVDYFPAGLFNAQLETVLAFTTIIGASLLTYRWIEQPAIALSKRLAPFSPRVPIRSLPPVALKPLPSQAE